MVQGQLEEVGEAGATRSGDERKPRELVPAQFPPLGNHFQPLPPEAARDRSLPLGNQPPAAAILLKAHETQRPESDRGALVG